MNLKRDLLIGGIAIVVLLGIAWYWSTLKQPEETAQVPATTAQNEKPQPSSQVLNEYNNDLQASDAASIDAEFQSTDSDINGL